MSDQTLIEVERVGKKYCRSLKQSMLYGVQDVLRDAFNLNGHSDLRKDEFWAVDDLSFQINAGECLGIIGPNGAGKSTLLKLLTGTILPDRGRITVRGRMGALIELGAGFHPMLSGRENIYINGAILGLSKREIGDKFDEIVAFAELDEFIDAPVKFYSSGMYMRLGFAIAAHLTHNILLIDEVLAVGDVAFRLKCFNHVHSLIENGAAVILVTHSLNDLARVCNRAMVLNHGKQVSTGNLADAVRRYQEAMHVTNKSGPIENTPVRFRSAKTMDDRGTEKKDFKSGEDVFVEIQYESKVTASDSVFIIKLASPELGEFVSFTNRVAGQKIPLSTGRGSIIVRLCNLPFLAGNYAVEVHLYDAEKNSFWDRAAPACTFNITEPVPEIWMEFDTVRIKHEWLIKNG